MEKIKIVLAKAHEKQMHHPNLKRELDDVQSFFNKRTFPLQKGTVQFVLLKGIYSAIERAMMIIGVFVNMTEHPICGLKASLQFHSLIKKEVRFAKIALELPPSFLGEIQHNEGFILHLKVPVQGLDAIKVEYTAPELTGLVTNVQVAYVN